VCSICWRDDNLLRYNRKYIGYKGFARYASLSDAFFVLRRYDRLHCRTLLTLQDHVAHLEEKLDLVDDRLSGNESPDIDNGTVRGDQSERLELIHQISAALKDYGRRWEAADSN
jgi:hypothetical protein